MQSNQAPVSWTMIVVAYAFFLLLFGGAVAAYSFFKFDTLLSCERSTDLCRVTQLRPFWTDEVALFPLSGVQSAAFERRGGNATTGGKISPVSTCAVLTMTTEPRTIDICAGSASPEYVAGISAFLSRPDVPAFASVIEANILDSLFPMFPAAFSLLPFFGGTSMLIRKVRRERSRG